MKIDTLILSGGGPSGIAYHGILRALFEHNIINKNLDNIKEIITTSIGILTSFILLIKVDLNISEKISLDFEFKNLLNLEDISIDNILDDFGLFDTNGIKKLFKSLIKNFLNLEDITLKELYNLNNIKLNVKVLNITKQKYEYISYETDPDLSIITLAQMTTAIPIFFKPIKYNNCLYVDGGFKNGFPILKCKSSNYLGIIIGGFENLNENKIFNDFPILKFIYDLIMSDDINDNYNNNEINIINNKRILINKVNLGINFDIEKKIKIEKINECYNNTINHLIKYNLISD